MKKQREAREKSKARIKIVQNIRRNTIKINRRIHVNQNYNVQVQNNSRIDRETSPITQNIRENNNSVLN